MEKYVIRPLLGLMALLGAIAVFFATRGLFDLAWQFAWYCAYVAVALMAVMLYMLAYMYLMDPKMPEHPKPD